MLKSYERDAILRELTKEVNAYLDPDAEEGTASECAERVMATVEKWAYLDPELTIGRLLDAHEAVDLASGKIQYCEYCEETFTPETDDQTCCSADCLHLAHGI